MRQSLCRPALMRFVPAMLFAALGLLSIGNCLAATLCTAVADATSGRMIVRQGSCENRVTPASTFKIAISLMGYDSGFLIDEHSPNLPFREGYPDWRANWRTATDPTSWIRNSVVWYSQQVTGQLGERRFQKYVKAFHYGNEDVSGDPGQHNGLTRAWLSSSLQISPLEELGFLERLVQKRLGVSARSYDMTSRITTLDAEPDGWLVHGKTGTGFPVHAGAADEEHAYGWFVGWALKGRESIVFVRLIQDEHAETEPAGMRARDALLKDLPALLGR